MPIWKLYSLQWTTLPITIVPAQKLTNIIMLNKN